MFSVISIAAITFLFIYAQGYQISKVEDTQKQAMDEYSAGVLLTLDHVTVDDHINYATVQETAVRKTNYPSILAAREWVGYIENEIETLDEIERSIDQTGGLTDAAEIVNAVENIGDEIEYLQDEVTAMQSSAEDIREKITDFTGNVEAVCDNIENISDIFGGVFGNIDCDINAEKITEPLDEIIIKTDEAYSDLDSLKSQVSGYKENLLTFPSDDVSEIKKSIHEIRCTLIAIKAEIDHFMNYFEVGADPDASLIDLWPVNVNFGGESVSRITGEALFVKNNLISTTFENNSFIRPLATAAGLFFLRNASTGMGDEIDELFDKIGEKEEVIEIYENTTDCQGSIDPECGPEPLSSLDLKFDGKGVSVNRNDLGGNCFELYGTSPTYSISGDGFAVNIEVGFKDNLADNCDGSPEPGTLTVVKNGADLDSYGFEKDHGNYEDHQKYDPYDITVRIAHTGSDTWTSPPMCLDETIGSDVIVEEGDGWRVVERTIKTTCYEAAEVTKYYFIDEYPMLNFVTINNTLKENRETIHFSVTITEGVRNISDVTEKKLKINISKQEIEGNETEKFLKQILLGFILLGREDLRDDIRDMTKMRLDNLLSEQGYGYCYEAVDECQDCENPLFSSLADMDSLGGRNKIIISSDDPDADSCDYVRYEDIPYSIAKQPLSVPENHRGEMKLYIWRK